MSVPSLTVQIQGQGVVTADMLNTYEQTCNYSSDLQNFVGVPGIQVFLRGFTAIGDGGQGNFYWNASGTTNDGINNIQPNGVSVGCWTRIPSSVGSITNATATGTNALVLTPINATVSSYVNLQAYGFIVPNTSTGPVTIQITGLAALNAYKNDGVTQINTGDFVAGEYVLVIYNSTLNSGAGGFQVVNQAYILNSPAFTGTPTAPTPAKGNDSTQIATTAFLWQNTLGGFINKFRNSSMVGAQYGSSGTVTSSPAYTLDGWIAAATGANLTWAISQTNGGAVPLNTIVFNGAASNTDILIKQRIESYDAAPLAGQSVTVQATIFNGSGALLTPKLTVKHATAADNWGGTVTDVSAVSLQTIPISATGVVYFTFVAAAGTINGLEVTFDFGALTVGTIDFFAPDIRNTPSIGTSPPPPEIPTAAADMARNQRYFYSIGESTGIAGTVWATSATAFGVYIPFQVFMRAAPTGITVTTLSDFEIVSMAGANVAAVTALTFGNASLKGLFLTGTVASGLTTATMYQFNTATALNGNLKINGADL